MTTPKRSAQPRQRGPIGRKMWQDDLGMVYHFRETALRGACGVDALVGRVLVIPRDPANVERIREKITQELSAAYSNYAGSYMRFVDDRGADVVLAALGLTPAKRRGKV